MHTYIGIIETSRPHTPSGISVVDHYAFLKGIRVIIIDRVTGHDYIRKGSPISLTIRHIDSYYHKLMFSFFFSATYPSIF